MTGLEQLLSRLTGVKKRANNQWSARCPAHEDKTPSLSLTESADGRILLHCFAGCGADAVMGAVGMTVMDLLPERLGTASGGYPPKPDRVPGHLLQVARDELRVLMQLAREMRSGYPLQPEDKKRLEQAEYRFDAILRSLREVRINGR